MGGLIAGALTGNMDLVSQAIFKGALDTVKLIINLTGPLALWLGIMNIARKSGLIAKISNLIRPFFRFLFPEIPPDHPAAGAIIMNLAANIMGMGNSATPLGIKAMQELQTLNKDKKKASYAMCTLLALNTSSITILPATMISLRATAGSAQPSIIFISTLFATTVSTVTALLLDKFFRVLRR